MLIQEASETYIQEDPFEVVVSTVGAGLPQGFLCRSLSLEVTAGHTSLSDTWVA